MFNIPPEFENISWLSNDSIRADIQLISRFQKRTVQASKVSSVNGVKLKKNYFSKISHQDSVIRIERQPNPSGQLALVFYEYGSRPFLDDSLLHISVVPKGRSIPLYGNLYIIQERLYNQIKKIEWTGEKAIRITINNSRSTYDQLRFYEIDEPYEYAEIALELKKETVYK